MTPHKRTGNIGEAMAVDFLVKKNYEILFTNWRFKQTEVDIIALLNNTVHFIEVKTRTQNQFGLPEDSINNRKMNALKKAAVAFMEANTNYTLLQFDVVSIQLNATNNASIFFIEDVFF